MDCLIIAAGAGSRLRAVSDSKPLTPVAGTPLVEHVIRRAIAGGASRFTVVTGHEAERVEACLHDLARELGIPIAAVRLPDWSQPNGWSMAAGAAGMDRPFLLMMADHLVDAEIINRLLRAPPSSEPLLLAVDFAIANPLLDLEDATRVQVGPEGRIVRIAKMIEPFDAVDTGVFLAGPELVRAHAACVAAGQAGSLSEAVQRLADQHMARVVDVTGLWWQDVDDPESLRLADIALRPP